MYFEIMFLFLLHTVIYKDIDILISVTSILTYQLELIKEMTVKVSLPPEL